jgi:glycosyltransferase involved in cell wall biosynthesis
MFSMLFERAYLNRAAFIHAISSEDLQGTRAYGVCNQFVLAPNCIDPALMPIEVDGTLVSRRFPAVKGKRLFTYMGRLDPEQKGLDTLLKAWAGVPSRDRGALILVGPDWRESRGQLEAFAQELGIAESVSFFGSVSGKEKWDVLGSTDVFVHPSRWEGFPFAVLEAMLAGKPLLLTQPADPGGQVAQAGAGVVVLPAEGDIRRALGHLMDADAEELGSLGRAARELVDREYRWEVTSGTVLRAYRTAVEG